MKAVARVDFRNGKRIVALVGRPPRNVYAADVIRFDMRRGARYRDGDVGVYMTPDEAAWAITVLGRALQRVTTSMRRSVARKYGRRLVGRR